MISKIKCGCAIPKILDWSNGPETVLVLPPIKTDTINVKNSKKIHPGLTRSNCNNEILFWTFENNNLAEEYAVIVADLIDEEMGI